MAVWFGADLHLGHNNIHKHRNKFDSMDNHDEYLLDMLSWKVGKNSPIYLLGDICFTHEALGSLAKLNTHKNIKIILGNHDTDRGIRVLDWVNAGFTDLHSLVKYKEFYLSHCPIHPDELRGKVNIHGHSHGHKVSDSRYVGVSMEQTDYNLISLESIRRALHEK